MKVFVSWSGGKESALSLARALSAGHEVACLVNMLDEKGQDSRGHGIRPDFLAAQAEALGFRIVHGKATWEGYEAELERIVRELKREGVEGGVFGDLRLEEHRDWAGRFCGRLGIEPIEPLWKTAYHALVDELLEGGFKAVIVNVRAGLIDEAWLGRDYSRQFVSYLSRRGIDLMGEGGEFHTFVRDGPMFKRPVEIIRGRAVERGERIGYEVLEFR